MNGSKLYAAQQRYSQRKMNNGNLRITVWTPEEHADELKAIAKSMRDGTWVSRVLK